MSRIGLKLITIPSGVEVTQNGQNVTVKGPKGSLSLSLPVAVTLVRDGEELRLSVAHPEIKKEKALWGTFRALLQNMVIGVTVGFTRALEINGIGYRANLVGKKIVLEVGFSHEVNFPLPDGVTAVIDKNVVTLSSIDKQLVGETAASIRRIRPPEPYKGTGIKYTDEIVRRKAGKAGKAGAA
ncbi:MAG: 50S ribosomal protein L6 [Patescibacteria group bacterium]|jgi:large subunit ribosomal protein L6